jgi:hypothetical protein
VEVEAGVGRSINIIAHDGGIESKLVGGMHAQLMGAPGKWPEMYFGYTLDRFNCLPLSNTCFAVFEAYHLSWPVKEIGPERKVDFAFGLWERTREQCCVPLLNYAVEKLLLNMLVYGCGFGYYEQPGCAHVEPVNNKWLCTCQGGFEPAVYRVADVYAGN